MSERKHDPRCEHAKNKDECHCSCGGALHSIHHPDNKDNPNFARVVNENLGGEVADFIRKVKGKYYDCAGVCGRKKKITLFMAYPHDGGLKDKDGKRWWVYVECTNKLKSGRECGYQMSFSKILNRLVEDKD